MSRNYKDNSGKNNANYKTGLKIKGNEFVGIYNTWQNMKARCLRNNHPKYPRYGGRGIKICNEWLSISRFYEWTINNGWQKGYSIDRVDNDKGYSPDNCRWISMSENSRKKRTTKITFEQAKTIRKRASIGENLYDLAKEYNVVHGTIWFIVKNFTHVEDGECTKALNARNKKDND